ncbi:MAG: cytochrome c3 family protein [Chloroflexi bacterium]|nr:cytochrome c3 family protein [Chloroflexota bacterium]
MSQLFGPAANTIAKASLIGALALLIAGAGFGYHFVHSPYVTGVGVAVAQPVPYSHAQHVGDLGLDCRYCHTAVETSNSAGVPPTESCMGCHAQVAVESDALQPVRASLENDQPLAWVRVHDLADYVYFNHAIHVRQGIGCESCHGRIDRMPVVAKAESLQMIWCLDCHRNPAAYIRPRQAVFTMGYQPPIEQSVLGPQLVSEYGIESARLADCSVCHR